MIREIVRIDEEKCNGCGICVPNCHEGALQIIDGKARLVSELMCDGLGACIGHCPEGAITVESREAEAYDEVAVIAQMVKMGKNTVFAHLKHLQEHNETGYLQQATGWLRANRESLPFSISEVHALLNSDGRNPTRPTGDVESAPSSGGGCPGSASRAFVPDAQFRMAPAPSATAGKSSELSHWPVQLHLINPAAAHYQGADLLVAADCVGFAHGDFHRTFLAGKKLVIACPKLDQGTDIYIQKLIRLVDEARVNTITVAIMEVPCCGGLIRMVTQALDMARRKVPVKIIVVSAKGEILKEEWI